MWGAMENAESGGGRGSKRKGGPTEPPFLYFFAEALIAFGARLSSSS